jgi:hypothetical protein
MKTKVCTACENEYPLTDEFYYRRRGSRDGFHHQCKDCRTEMYRGRYKAKQADRSGYEIDDPLVRDAKCKPGYNCALCTNVLLCRELVLTGQQVLCAPEHESDILSARVYAERVKV